jgi:hypothetical protein
MRSIMRLDCLPLLVLLSASALAGVPDDRADAFFEAKVRPLLVERCFQCHSDSAKKLKGDLHLDSHEGVLAGGEAGAVVVPGHPEQSRLVEAIHYTNQDLLMPPKGKLSDAEIATLTQWVAMGMPWPAGEHPHAVPAAKPVFDIALRKAGHWAWKPVAAQTPPDVKDKSWPASSIDRFILAKLEAQGLKPAAPANKRSLIRRAYFDLIGLPPKPQDVDVFVNDASPDAFAKVVDGLLANPHFGERWARHWMDLARYAETYGHEFDYPIAEAWRYRDYLIRALNADVPYDQFVREQIAGDLLPKPRLNAEEGYDESIIGTGFWFFGEQTHSPVDVRQHQADRIDNQIDVVGKTFLGLTVACARCHDHKFDAISQKDYYSLFSIIESSRRQDALLDPHGQIDRSASELQQLRDRGAASLRAALPAPAAVAEEFSRSLANADSGPGNDLAPSHPMYAWAALSKADNDQTFTERRAAALAAWTKEKDAAETTAAASTLFKSFGDGNYAGWFSSGWAFGNGPTQSGQWLPEPGTARFALPGLAGSGTLAGRLRGVLRSPTFTISKPQVFYRMRGRGRVHLVIDGFMMDQFNGLLFAQTRFEINSPDKFIWHREAGDIGRYLGHSAYIELIDDGDGSLTVDQIRFADNDAPLPTDAPSPLAGRLLSDPGIASKSDLARAYGAAARDAIGRLRDGKADRDETELVNWALAHELVKLEPSAESELLSLSAKMKSIDDTLPDPIKCQAVADGSAIDERIFVRGSYKTPGKPAARQFLEALGGNAQSMSSENTGRLELAREMTDPARNPFITRVMVNRLWHHLIGRGIVASTDNFGVLGSPPSHPELLDFLADQFVRENWSIKRAIRDIMLTSTYQMDSRSADAATEQADPDNVLLHRANVRRLEAEEIRDEVLAVSGRLDLTMFGPPVNVFLTPFMEGRGRPASGPMDGDGRRSIYLAEKRNFLSPMMLAFDQPIPFSSMGRRTTSNVPAQALILMNDPFVIAQAKLWADQVLQDKSADVRTRVTKMYQTAFGREPDEREIAAATAFLDKQGAELGLPTEQRTTDAHVWADLAHALMNVKEFVFLR